MTGSGKRGGPGGAADRMGGVVEDDRARRGGGQRVGGPGLRRRSEPGGHHDPGRQQLEAGLAKCRTRAEQGLVLLLEPLEQLVHRGFADVAGRQRYVQMMRLAAVADRHAGLDEDVRGRAAPGRAGSGGQSPGGYLTGLRDVAVQQRQLSGGHRLAGRDARIAGLLCGYPQVAGADPVGGLGRGGRRHDERGDTEVAAQGPGVRGSLATAGEHGELAGIVAALDGDAAQQVGHPGVQDPPDPPGGLHDVDAERAGDLLFYRVPRGGPGQPHDAAGESRLVEHAENQVGVGGRHLGAAAPVADGTGRGAGAVRPDQQRALARHPGDAATAGADRADVDGRAVDVRSAHRDLVAHQRRAVGDDAHVETGPADVDGEQPVPGARAAADLLAGHDPGDGA